ncbi:MAG: molybdopterin-dependent oxidoreductase [Candidatus Eremiobacteraeota bacterium]|nr:molybdopterin-dependent oxidoreductase [Candidatus Eremiobacteraeota bacterium]
MTLALLRMDEGAPVRARAGASRARFVTNALSAVVAFAGAGSLFALFRRATFSYDGTPYIGPDVKPITPNDRFYQVTKNVIDPDVALANWELQVGGMVASAQTLTLGNLRAFANVEQETTLSCISNPVGGGLMSNAIWKGVPLAAVLDVAKPASDGTRVLLRAADGYTDTIDLKKAMERTTLLAYEMNSETLPRRHGFPVRMIVPGLFGEKSVKWLTGIEIVPDTVQGFYQKQGWGPDFVIPTQSRFDVPGPMDRLRSGAPVELKGIAFGGHRGISAVEVSTDGGRSWSPAQIAYPATLLRWALWTFPWRPKSTGSYQLVVRAKAANGEPQIATDRPTATQGSTGYHRVNVAVV